MKPKTDLPIRIMMPSDTGFVAGIAGKQRHANYCSQCDKFRLGQGCSSRSEDASTARAREHLLDASGCPLKINKPATLGATCVD